MPKRSRWSMDRDRFGSGLNDNHASYYLDATLGNNANTGLSEAQAWQTLAKVNGFSFAPGDQIFLKRGETWTDAVNQYALSIATDGVVIGAYGSGNAPIIVGAAGVTEAFCVLLSGDNTQVANLKLTTAKEGGVRVSGAGCQVHGNDITNCGAGLWLEGPNCQVYNNDIHHLKIVVSDATPDNDYGAVGVWFMEGCNGALVHHNTFRYCIAPSTDYGTDGGAFEVWGTVDDVDVYSNFALHCSGFAEFGAPTGAGDIVSNFRVYNNVVNQCARLALFNTVGGPFGIAVQGVNFEHNTASSSFQYVVIFSTTNVPTGANLVFRNNVLYGFRNFSSNGNGDPFTHTYNLYSGAGPATPGAGEVVLTDPLLVAAPFVDMTFDANFGWSVGGRLAFDQGADSISAANFAVNANAALNSSAYGMRVTLPTGTAAFEATKLVKMPTDVSDIWLDFWLDPNAIAMNVGDEFFLAADYLGQAPWQSWRLIFDRWDSPYRIVLDVVNDAGASQYITSGSISDGPHHIRARVKRASSAVAANGEVTLFIDNMASAVGSVTGVDNFDIFLLIQSYQFGRIFSGTFAGAGGVYFLDGFRAALSASGVGTDVASDLNLASGSPCRNAGTNVGIATDYFGATRPLGAAVDIGAHEFVE